MYVKSPLKRLAPTSTAILLVCVILSLTISPLFNIPKSNHAIAQPAFYQPVNIFLDKSNYLIENYGVIVYNMDTDTQVINFYTDYENSPRYQAIEGSISTRDGDRLIACVMNMMTAEIACDTQTAYYNQDTTEFYVDMNNAQSITEEEAGYDQFGMDDYQAYVEECQCGCNTAFYSSEEGEITKIVNRPNCAGVPSMR